MISRSDLETICEGGMEDERYKFEIMNIENPAENILFFDIVYFSHPITSILPYMIAGLHSTFANT